MTLFIAMKAKYTTLCMYSYWLIVVVSSTAHKPIIIHKLEKISSISYSGDSIILLN